MEAAQHQLDRLDAIAADGDHGATMVAGWRAAEAAVAAARSDPGAEASTELRTSVGPGGSAGVRMGIPAAWSGRVPADAEAAMAAGEFGPGRVLRDAAEAFSDVGGSIGPLWGTALLRAGLALGDTAMADLASVRTAVEAGVAGIAERGRSQEGDKTLLDVLGPASRAFCAAVDAGSDGAVAALAGLAAAERGLRASAELVPRRGRALRLGSRSQGHQDPGAASACLILREAAIAAGAAVADAEVAGTAAPSTGVPGARVPSSGGAVSAGTGPVEVAG
jgi:dihydroxyacetone kinase-like protein